MSPVQRRLERLRRRLAEESLDGLLVTNLTNVHYLSNFTGSAGTCLILMDSAYFFSDGRYSTQSKEQVEGMEILIGADPHLEIMKKSDVVKNGWSLGFEANHLTVSELDKLSDLFPRCTWEPTSLMVEAIAAVKDEAELRAIRTAVEITDEVFDQIVPELRLGVQEREIAAKLSYMIKILGADGDAFDPIVAGGPNSALPHAVPSHREFEEGDFVVLDFGARYRGYHADMTRTVVMGTASDKQREVYEVVREAQQRGWEAAKAGMTCKELDSIARDCITKNGYGDRFVHSTGHGLGLEIHTMPRLSQLSEDGLLENYVVTIEPGIYLPDWGGVRIEDDVIIKKEGCEVLNKSTRDLLVLR
ncbi:MAG: aminopeptidase P family protein [Fidelibacterota bacterium]